MYEKQLIYLQLLQGHNLTCTEIEKLFFDIQRKKSKNVCLHDVINYTFAE